MTDWDLGYVSEVNYESGFYYELSPTFLGFVQQIKDHLVPENIQNYCELGCGFGSSTNLLAAANPEINFYANDFIPSHIVGANAVAQKAGLTNVSFYDSAFADFIDEPSLPDSFDIIVMHGIFSWINEENREIILEFISRKLKVGGIVYLSYNALPGWASAMPMRHFLSDQANQATGHIFNRLESALDFTETFMKNSKYFLSTNGIVDRINSLRSLDNSYVVHEYLNENWTPFYFNEVVRYMEKSKLDYVGSSILLDYIDDLNLTKPQQELLNSESDDEKRQVLRDYLVNRQFRKDVFSKGYLRSDSEAARDSWLESRFVLIRNRSDIDLKIAGPLGEAQLQENVYGPLLDAFSSGPVSLRDAIKNNPAISALGWQQLRQALILLTGAEIVHKCLPYSGEAKRKKTTKLYNDNVIDSAIAGKGTFFLASPVTGSGIAVNRLDLLFLLARKRGARRPDDWASAVWRIFSERGEKIVESGVKLGTSEENINYLKAKSSLFESKILPVLSRLGISDNRK